jgi:16S rRNA G966 N2-methylase RsmD
MSKAKVFIVPQEYRAKYKVFFVDQPYKEKNAEIIKGGQLVKLEFQADTKVFIVEHEYKADIKITMQNFPR